MCTSGFQTPSGILNQESYTCQRRGLLWKMQKGENYIQYYSNSKWLRLQGDCTATYTGGICMINQWLLVFFTLFQTQLPTTCISSIFIWWVFNEIRVKYIYDSSVWLALKQYTFFCNKS
jgi:hypothetical protein